MQASPVIKKNTPKGLGANSVADIPSAYQVKQFECVNKDGAVFDISKIVTSFTICEELFSPVLVLNIRIRDTINFFEDFALNGQEFIRLKLDHDTSSKMKSVYLEFSVKEYPNYRKTAAEPNVQEYSLIAVSKFGYNSMLQRISRSVKGNPVDQIRKILDEDLDVESSDTSNCVSMFDGIITTQTPLKAIEWLRTKSFDVDGSPIFVYSAISDDKIKITSLKELWSSNNQSFRTYYYKQFIANPANTHAAYIEQQTRILDMQSNIRIDKLNQSVMGGFASKTNTVDIGSKSYVEQIYKFKEKEQAALTINTFRELFSLNKNIKIGGQNKSLNELPDASVSNISTNTSANYLGNPNSTTGPIAEYIQNSKSFFANMDAITHQIMVYGDFLLNPGRRITVKIPKAINVDRYNESINPNNNEQLDLALSGDYIVSTVVHTFQEGLYTAKLKIIKDA